MGYTIYLSLPSNKVMANTEENIALWRKTCDKIREGWKKIPKKYKDDENSSYDIEYHGLGDGAGEGEPVINDKYICFNGRASWGDDHEGFYFGAFEKVEGLDSFCKTARKGYTMAVMIAILCIQKYFNPDLKYSSDGGDKAAWAKAREIIKNL